jgi:hypothetical protein
MAKLNFRKLHRQVAPIIFLPLTISAITGLIFALAIDWGKVSEDSIQFLMVIHAGEYLKQLQPIYLFFLALGVIGLIVTGLIVLKPFSKRPERPDNKLDFRKIHRIAAPIIFLPLVVSTVTGLIYGIGTSWFRMSGEVGDVFLNIHQGEYLGEFLTPIYVLFVGLGAILMLISGINLTGIFRKKRQPKTDEDS